MERNLIAVLRVGDHRMAVLGRMADGTMLYSLARVRDHRERENIPSENGEWEAAYELLAKDLTEWPLVVRIADLLNPEHSPPPRDISGSIPESYTELAWFRLGETAWLLLCDQSLVNISSVCDQRRYCLVGNGGWKHSEPLNLEEVLQQVSIDLSAHQERLVRSARFVAGSQTGGNRPALIYEA